MDYTLGFVFDASFEKVLLMHKLKPERQAGKLNGLGGKVEEGEAALDCVAREIFEEAGLKTDPSAWSRIGCLRGDRSTMDVFAYVHRGALSEASSQEAETVYWVDVRTLSENVMENLRWLIPMAVDKLKNHEFESFVIDGWH